MPDMFYVTCFMWHLSLEQPKKLVLRPSKAKTRLDKPNRQCYTTADLNFNLMISHQSLYAKIKNYPASNFI